MSWLSDSFRSLEDKTGFSSVREDLDHRLGISAKELQMGIATGGVSLGTTESINLFNKEAQDERHRTKDAAKMQEGAALRAENALTAMQEADRADTAPWRTAGQTAIKQLQDKVQAGPGQFTPGPRYQQRFQSQVERPLAAQASASGRLGGGAYQKQLRRGAMDFAGQEHDNWLNRYYSSLQPLQSLSGMGQTITGQGANAAMQGANALSGQYMNQAAIQSDQIQGQAITDANRANALGQSAQALGGMWDNYSANNANTYTAPQDTSGGWEDTSYYSADGAGAEDGFY